MTGMQVVCTFLAGALIMLSVEYNGGEYHAQDATILLTSLGIFLFGYIVGRSDK